MAFEDYGFRLVLTELPHPYSTEVYATYRVTYAGRTYRVTSTGHRAYRDKQVHLSNDVEVQRIDEIHPAVTIQLRPPPANTYYELRESMRIHATEGFALYLGTLPFQPAPVIPPTSRYERDDAIDLFDAGS